MISAHRHDVLMTEAEQLRIDAFLVKPVDKSLLLETIAALFTKTTPMLATSAQSAAPTIAAPELQGAHILLVEDNAINQQIGIEFLSDAGIQVTLAVNGREAVEKACSGVLFDAILMDVQMPEMDGLEATRKIREHLGSLHLPIIAMTAQAMEIERLSCLAVGMNDHIAKPIVPQILFATLERWLLPRRPKASAAPTPAITANIIATSSTVFPQNPEGILPDSLPPFDLKAAVSRMGGKQKLVLKSLIGFYEGFNTAPTEINRLVLEDKMDELLRLAHTIKGIAATLEAKELAIAAGALENALGSKRPDGVQLLIEPLRAALIPALEAAAKVLPTPATTTANPAPTMSAINPIEVNRLLAELRTLLAKNSTKARKAITPLREALAGLPLDPHFDAVAAHLERFDFRGAENSLTVLVSHLPVQEQHP